MKTVVGEAFVIVEKSTISGTQILERPGVSLFLDHAVLPRDKMVV